MRGTILERIGISLSSCLRQQWSAPKRLGGPLWRTDTTSREKKKNLTCFQGGNLCRGRTSETRELGLRVSAVFGPATVGLMCKCLGEDETSVEGGPASHLWVPICCLVGLGWTSDAPLQVARRFRQCLSVTQTCCDHLSAWCAGRVRIQAVQDCTAWGKRNAPRVTEIGAIELAVTCLDFAPAGPAAFCLGTAR